MQRAEFRIGRADGRLRGCHFPVILQAGRVFHPGIEVHAVRTALDNGQAEPVRIQPAGENPGTGRAQGGQGLPVQIPAAAASLDRKSVV